jgi:hypothetical protein
MANYSGQDAKILVKLQSAWGTYEALDDGDYMVDFSSESINFVPEYVEEDTLTGAKTSRRMDIMAVSASGDIGGVVRPGGATSMFIAAALGYEASGPVEVAGGAYEHTITPISGSNSLPIFSVLIDRKALAYDYDSMEIGQLTLEASAKDYLRYTASFVGRHENGTQTSMPSPLPAYNNKVPFMFKQGTLSIEGGGTYSDSVTSFTFTYNNNLEDLQQVMSSGIYAVKPECQKRDITISMDTLFDTDLATLRTNKYKAGATMSVELTFVSSEVITAGYYYEMTLTLPAVQITAMNPNVGGPERIKATIEGRALEGAAEACTISLIDTRSTKWTA